jgi:hypothetical protein
MDIRDGRELAGKERQAFEVAMCKVELCQGEAILHGRLLTCKRFGLGECLWDTQGVLTQDTQTAEFPWEFVLRKERSMIVQQRET